MKTVVLDASGVLVDWQPHNAEGAGAVGMDGIHFTGAPAIAEALITRGVL